MFVNQLGVDFCNNPKKNFGWFVIIIIKKPTTTPPPPHRIVLHFKQILGNLGNLSFGMQSCCNPTRKNLKNNLNIFENIRQPQFLGNGRLT